MHSFGLMWERLHINSLVFPFDQIEAARVRNLRRARWHGAYLRDAIIA
jgi:hypothetical protein